MRNYRDPVPAFDFRMRSNPKFHRDHGTTQARLVYSAAAKILSRLHPPPTFSFAIHRYRRRNSLTRNRPLMYESCSNQNLFGVVTRRTWNFSVWYPSFLWHSARTRLERYTKAHWPRRRCALGLYHVVVVAWEMCSNSWCRNRCYEDNCISLPWR